MPKCCHCKEEKSMDSFYKKAIASNGLSPECKDCSRKRENKKNSDPSEKEKNRLKSEVTRKNLFCLCLNHYGKECFICKNKKTLSIDHINGNDGNSPEGGVNLWRYLIRNNFPAGFRTLCRRCNLIDGLLRKNPLWDIKGIDSLILQIKNKEKL